MKDEVVEAVEQTSDAVIDAVEKADDIGSAVDSVTQSAQTFFEWIKKFITWEYFFKVIGLVIIVCILFLVYKLAARAVKRVPREKLSEHKSSLIVRGFKYLYYFIAAMAVLGFFGVKLSGIWGAAGVAGVGLAFAAQTSLSNIISGIFIVAEKTMKIGDLITVGNDTGFVDVIGLLSVQIKTLDNQLIRIPNSTIINSNMVNTTYFPKRRMCIGVSVSYDTDMEYAMKTLKKVPGLCETVLKDPEPLVWFEKFDESGINLTLAVWFKNADFLKTKNDVYVAIKKEFDKAGISIPYNKLDVNFIGVDNGDVTDGRKKVKRNRK